MRSSYKTEAEWKECLKFGSYQAASRTMLVSTNRKYLQIAIDSYVPLAFCDVTASDRCYAQAQAFQSEVFSGN